MDAASLNLPHHRLGFSWDMKQPGQNFSFSADEWISSQGISCWPHEILWCYEVSLCTNLFFADVATGDVSNKTVTNLVNRTFQVFLHINLKNIQLYSRAEVSECARVSRLIIQHRTGDQYLQFKGDSIFSWKRKWELLWDKKKNCLLNCLWMSSLSHLRQL